MMANSIQGRDRSLQKQNGGSYLRRILSWPIAYLVKDPLAFMRALFLIRFAKDSTRALDAGCGMGGLTLVLAMRAKNVVGLSISQADAAIAARRAGRLRIRNVQFVVCDLRELGNETGHIGLFDTIVLFDVIEHILDDKRVIRQLYCLLNPGGQLLVTSPHLGTKHFPGERISESEDGGHVRWGYSTDDMIALCTQGGFRVERIETFGGPVTYGLVYVMRILDRNPFTKLLGQGIAFLFRPFQLMETVLIKLTSYVPYQVGAVARKDLEGRAR